MAGIVEEDVKPGFYRVEFMKSVWYLPNRYQDLQPLGSGAFGTVVSALNSEKGKRVAIKKLRRAFATTELAKRSYREIKILKHMSHENVIGLLDVFSSARNLDELKDVFLVSELMELDLDTVIKQHSDRNDLISSVDIQLIVYQLFRACKYFHAAGIVHRDLKTENIAINQDSMIKILDFGLACPKRDRQQTAYVVTRWYRAPEIILGSLDYDSKADIWSIGCVMAELMGGQVLFTGSNEFDQIQQILDMLGSPNEAFIQKVASPPAQYYLRQMEQKPKRNYPDVFPKADPLAVDLLEQVLLIDPDLRISAIDALNHPYLQELHDPDDENEAPPFDASYEDEGKSIEDWRRLTYNEIEHFHSLSSQVSMEIPGPSKKKKEEDVIDLEEMQLKEISREDNEDGRFGAFVAAALSKMEPRKKMLARKKIHQTLYDVEHGHQSPPLAQPMQRPNPPPAPQQAAQYPHISHQLFPHADIPHTPHTSSSFIPHSTLSREDDYTQ